MTTNEQNQSAQQNSAQNANAAVNQAEQNAEATDLHIEQTTPMQADKEAFEE